MHKVNTVTGPQSLKKLQAAKSKLAIFVISVVLLSSLLSENSYAQQSTRRKNIDPALQMKIDKAVQKASDFLRNDLKVSKQIGYKSLGVYALMSANEYQDKAEIVDSVCQGVMKHIESKFDQSGEYKPMLKIPVYEAGVDLLALSKAHKYTGLHYSHIQAVINFLAKEQDSTGFWSYPRGTANREQGDTSMSQYAVLGLWAAEVLADARVPANVWQKALKWHTDTQYANGGFAYHPGGREDGTTLTMTAAGLGTLYICRQVMSGNIKKKSEKKKKRNIKFRDLKEAETGKTKEEIEKERKQNQGANGRSSIGFNSAPVGAAIGKAQVWLSSNFKLPSLKYPLYYMYSIERIGFFMGDSMFGRDWYVDGAKHLIDSQQSKGHWNGGVRPTATTSYGILFLTRATERFGPPKTWGAGNLRGNSGGIDFSKITGEKDGKPVLTKGQQEFKESLNQLEAIGDLDVTDLLIPQIVKEIEFDPKKKELLLKDAKLMKKLWGHSKPELRQIAIWATGKTGDINEVPKLIKALEDNDQNVMREAHLALCYISRKPLGPKDKKGGYLPIGPKEISAVKLAKGQKRMTPQQWSREAVDRWNEWYLRVRPYDQRDDLKDSKKKITGQDANS